jgi:hypothetical protein
MSATNDETELYNFEQIEIQRTDCFLCQPAKQLVAHMGTDHYTMDGLGPLTDAYAIVATNEHGTGEEKDNHFRSPETARYAEKIQAMLATQFGTCVLTEHGKMPVCLPNTAADTHCFHPHFLLFPGAPYPLTECRDFFETNGDHFESLIDALQAASALQFYFLVSSRPGEYYIFDADGLPQQYARGIVAELLDRPGNRPSNELKMLILKEIQRMNE